MEVMGTDLMAMIMGTVTEGMGTVKGLVEDTVTESTAMGTVKGLVEDTEGTVTESTAMGLATGMGTVTESTAMGMGTVMEAGTGTSKGIAMVVVTSKGSRVMGVQAAPAAVTPTRGCSQRDMTYPVISRKRSGFLSPPVLYYTPRTNPKSPSLMYVCYRTISLSHSYDLCSVTVMSVNTEYCLIIIIFNATFIIRYCEDNI